MKTQQGVIRYPISKETTTVKSVLENLRVLDGSGLRQALLRGQITLDGVRVDKGGSRVAAGQTLRYADMTIQVYLDEELKRKRLTQTVMTGGTQFGTTVGKAGGFGYNTK